MQSAADGGILNTDNSPTGENDTIRFSRSVGDEAETTDSSGTAVEGGEDEKAVDRVYYPDKKKAVKITYYLDGTKKIEYKGVVIRNVQSVENYAYFKQYRDEARRRRSRFSRKDRTVFLNYLVDEHLDELCAIGLTDKEIKDMRKGVVPDGYEVHHLFSLDDSGTNENDNLILIAQKYHSAFTRIQVSFCKSIKEGQTLEVVWFYPMGKVYNPNGKGE